MSTQTNPQPVNPLNNPGSVAPPDDKQIPYVVNALGVPSLPTPGAGLPGHKSNPEAARAAAAATHQAAQADADRKRAAQFKQDTRSRTAQHANARVTYTRKGR